MVGMADWRSGCSRSCCRCCIDRGIVAAAFAGAAIGGAISYGTQAVSGELNWGQFA